jgi:acyl carrier protein phosphodiesterase
MGKEDYSKALFNEGVLIARRLDVLQSRINSVRINPLAFNIEQNCYNYLVWYGDLCSLLNEVWSKLTDEEQKQVTTIRKLLDEALTILPPHSATINERLNKKEVKVNYERWNKIKNILSLFETEIKTYLDRHGFANPDVEGGDMF